MEKEILSAIKHVKNTSEKQATFARIYSIMKKTHKNLTENEWKMSLTISLISQLQNIISVKNLIPFLILMTTLVEQTHNFDKDATQTPSEDNENLTDETQLQGERYEVIDKDITKTCDIALNT